MKAPCACGRIHASNEVVAVFRFSVRPTRYAAWDQAADQPYGPLRDTRTEAMADVCPEWVENTT